MGGFFKFKFLFESHNDGNDGQHEIDRVVVEKLASDFGAESAEVELVSAYTGTMETETDEVVLEIPSQNGQNQIDGNKQGAIKCPGFERFLVENEDIKHQSDPKKHARILGEHGQTRKCSEQNDETIGMLLSMKSFEINDRHPNRQKPKPHQRCVGHDEDACDDEGIDGGGVK